MRRLRLLWLKVRYLGRPTLEEFGQRITITNTMKLVKRDYTCTSCPYPHDPAFKCGEKK